MSNSKADPFGTIKSACGPEPKVMRLEDFGVVPEPTKIVHFTGQNEVVKDKQISLLPADYKERKHIPLGSGVMDYFPAALIEVAKISYAGNEQHNPGEPLHWARGKSMDQADTMMRHYMERGTLDTDGLRHSAKMVWRALALLQLEMEAAGSPQARGAY